MGVPRRKIRDRSAGLCVYEEEREREREKESFSLTRFDRATVADGGWRKNRTADVAGVHECVLFANRCKYTAA